MHPSIASLLAERLMAERRSDAASVRFHAATDGARLRDRVRSAARSTAAVAADALASLREGGNDAAPRLRNYPYTR